MFIALFEKNKKLYTSPRAPPERKLDKEPLCIKKTPVVSVHPHNSNAASVLDSYDSAKGFYHCLYSGFCDKAADF
eukprot:XP_019072371.1 PREDICTED: uncharacterized protein LOC100855387 isoform X2 [Vitis vinifera]